MDAEDHVIHYEEISAMRRRSLAALHTPGNSREEEDAKLTEKQE